MKLLALATSLLAFTALATLDIAALGTQLPRCSLSCVVSTVQSSGCAATDLACLCVRVEPLLASFAPCLVKAGCTLRNVTDTVKVLLSVCKQEVPDSVHAGSSLRNTKSVAASVAMQGIGWALIAVMTAVALPVGVW